MVKLIKLSNGLARLALIVVGITVGMAATILVQMNSEGVLNLTLLWGVVIGLGLAVLAVLLYAALGPKTLKDPTPEPSHPSPEAARAAIDAAAKKWGITEDELDGLLAYAKRQGSGLAVLAARFWSSATALGTAVAITGSVIAMITAIAALRQVDRIDAQNALIEQQIEEAKASRAASVFAAQLPSLLAAIDAERNGRLDLWIPSSELIARIQSIVDLAEPYKSYPEIDQAVTALNEAAGLSSHEKMLFSPQRGQLLRLLLAAGIDFEKLTTPLNFSSSDLTGITLRPVRIVELMNLAPVALGDIDMSGSNFFRTPTHSLRFNGANLERAVFANVDQVRGIEKDLNTANVDNEAIVRISGTVEQPSLTPIRFAGAIILAHDHVEELRQLGWFGLSNLKSKPGDPTWRRNEDTLTTALGAYGVSGRNPLIFQGIAQVADGPTGTAIRFDDRSLLTEVETYAGLNKGVYALFETCNKAPNGALAVLQQTRTSQTVHPKLAWAATYALSQFRRKFPMLGPCANSAESTLITLDEALDLP